MHDSMIDFDSVTPDIWISNEQTWKEKLLSLPNWYKIPLINSNASHSLSDGSLVRFRGMIQDMHDPEFYFEEFEIVNTTTNEVKSKSGKYRDTAHVLDNEKINYTENLKSAQRNTMVVISIPGLNDWAQKLEYEQNHLKHLENQPNTSRRSSEKIKLKRSYDETVDDEPMEMANESTGKKEQRTKEELDNLTVSKEHILNFPIPDVPSQSCIVKVYEEDEGLKLNELVEVVGFLSVDPALSGEFHTSEEDGLGLELESEEERLARHPPPSLVPRLHAVFIRKLTHCNPMLELPLDDVATLSMASEAREYLLRALTGLLYGDTLAAEYTLLHLLSHVYLWTETLTLGHMSLNLTNVPADVNPSLAKTLHDALSAVTTHSVFLPLTLDNLNTLTFIPTKDYARGRLSSGLLQLSAGTRLLLDETALGAGRLGEAGLRAVAGLTRLAADQSVEYDFHYYRMSFRADAPVLVLSEGKSLLKCEWVVPLSPGEDVRGAGAGAAREAAAHFLRGERVAAVVRRFLSAVRVVQFELRDDTQYVQEDFVAMRMAGGAGVGPDALHRLLVLARLVALSRGQRCLDQLSWQHAKTMEEQRAARLASTP